ncbi:2-oxoglutarate dehydrogenase complex dihydrolipoyllysine-residue succinyltransferase [Aquirhabdus parva]|uniref:Dihydrolipoyllysine-residue succinyltransferase component of 2-oxoglutarate dehydrogenase complex n=1 Tax=Aquirhabdus parva TaxID=2283318 RepID=A0A345P4E0_9GAMM|nr:2-oxoglutarate dehydrogenase complex dihydrolipoyllysine-residue succinyltransferase [Aquirhabdus parva]AXI02149.1 2-oxoglutarate dehydrogenase complex dihydrolipoyllysine-residue succinyltransferase [Aquirhabdus parva]
MATEIKAPVFPESVADGTVAAWHKKVGEAVKRDEVLADIETDKVVLEVVAPADGVLTSIVKNEGDTVLSGEVLAQFDAGGAAAPSIPAHQEPAQAGAMPISERDPAVNPVVPDSAPQTQSAQDQSPAVRKAVTENNINPADIEGSGRGGRVTKEDVVAHVAAPKAAPAAAAPTATAVSLAVGERVEKRVPMTRLRQRVAQRLLSASQDTAMLTTFNEVNMKPIMDMRKAYGDRFEKRHGTRLGFMSFFVKAATEALKRFPAVNASLDGNDIVYHGYYDIGVAVSSDRGLVVPVLRDTDRMNLAEVEKNIIDYGTKARDGKLGIDDMTGGTFTISNGGVFGSLLSTPILNPPQTAILGMHKIQQRPMAVDGQVVILPMMYLALSYDHRMIDGKEAVSFLVTLKDLVEDPALLLLDL